MTDYFGSKQKRSSLIVVCNELCLDRDSFIFGHEKTGTRIGVCSSFQFLRQKQLFTCIRAVFLSKFEINQMPVQNVYAMKM